MKFIILLILLVPAAFAKTQVDFNEVLNEDFKSDIQKDDFNYKKKALRAPASVEADDQMHEIKETPKIDKTVRQTGHSNW